MVVSFLFFTVATFLLICVHRVMLAHGRRTLAIFLVYPIGAFVLGWVMSWSAVTVVLYVLLSLSSFIWLITSVLGDTPPTSRIMALLRIKRRASHTQIKGMFSNTEMIWKRLNALASAGLVQVNSGRYTTTTMGRMVAWGIEHYLRILAWEPNV